MDSNKAVKKVVDEIMGYFGMDKDDEKAREALTISANILIGVGFDLGRRSTTNPGKPVVQMDMSEKIVAVFGMMKQAANITGIDRSAISNACSARVKRYKGKTWTVRSAGGYKWKFLNPDDYYKQKHVT